MDVTTGALRLRACVADLDGRSVLVHEAAVTGGDPAELGRVVARKLLADGAAELVTRAEKEIRRR